MRVTVVQVRRHALPHQVHEVRHRAHLVERQLSHARPRRARPQRAVHGLGLHPEPGVRAVRRA